VERKTNISVWQLQLFEGFDKDIMVMQRDEQEVFDDAIHVFFDKEYYDAYVARAGKYGTHAYAYHEDKLGEVVNQIFDEHIPGLVLHISTDSQTPKNVLVDEKYIAAGELIGLKSIADSYHFLYMTSIDRCVKEDAIARLWIKDVFIIGQIPHPGMKLKEGEKPVFELMTMKRKKGNEKVTLEDFDYESLKVFLTAESAMRFNPDKKPVSKYKLSMLSRVVKGRFQIVIEPHRNYWMEYDPAALDLKGHLDLPHFDEEIVKERLHAFAQMDKIYILLNPFFSDYKTAQGNPFLMKQDGNNVFMYLFEDYENAVNYVLQNPTLLPVFDSTFPIGVLDQRDKMLRLETVFALAAKLGVMAVNFDMDTLHGIVCKLDFIKDVLGYSYDVETLLSKEELSNVLREEEGKKQYRMPIVPFYDQHNDFIMEEERKEELIAHIDHDTDQGIAYLAGSSLPEMMVVMQEAARRFDEARKAQDEENQKKYTILMNKITIPLAEALCEKPYIYTLREENGDFSLKNNLVYLIVTNRYEASRKGEGRLMPVGIDNPQFMEKLCEASKVAILTDGPSLLCLVDTKLISEVAKQWKSAAPLREELMIYLTQGCNLPYTEAAYYYRRLKSDSNIFVEFVSAVKAGEYPSIGMLTIEGHTAMELAETYGFLMPQAYDCLLSLKTDADFASRLENDVKPKEASGADEQAAEEKKGFFGRIFQNTHGR